MGPPLRICNCVSDHLVLFHLHLILGCFLYYLDGKVFERDVAQCGDIAHFPTLKTSLFLTRSCSK